MGRRLRSQRGILPEREVARFSTTGASVGNRLAKGFSSGSAGLARLQRELRELGPLHPGSITE
jgi:hypothetical protein